MSDLLFMVSVYENAANRRVGLNPESPVDRSVLEVTPRKETLKV
jgi:hypothetical protein